MKYRTRLYLHGLAASLINGASNGIVVMIVDPSDFNILQGGAIKLGSVCAISALVSAATYLKEHPLPEPTDTDGIAMAAKQIAKIAEKAGTGSGDDTTTGTGPGTDK